MPKTCRRSVDLGGWDSTRRGTASTPFGRTCLPGRKAGYLEGEELRAQVDASRELGSGLADTDAA
jgi:hypothetical protein